MISLNLIKEFFNILVLFQLTSLVYSAGILEGRQTKLRFEGELGCSRDGIVQSVPMEATINHRASCNGLFAITNYTAVPARIIVRDRVVLVPRTNPIFILDLNNGKIFGTWYYEIDEGLCRGGVGFLEIKYEDTDPRACTSRHGLRLLEDIPIFYEIRGGKCETECSGTINVHFSPGLIDYDF